MSESDNVLGKEELIIKFYTTHNDDDNRLNIEYEIKDNNDTTYTGIFINENGELVKDTTENKSFNTHLHEVLKSYTNMPKVYAKYIKQNPNTIMGKIKKQVLPPGVTTFSELGTDIKQKMLPTGVTKFSNLPGAAWSGLVGNTEAKRVKGGKTKSKRSYNANKTLKNRK